MAWSHCVEFGLGTLEEVALLRVAVAKALLCLGSIRRRLEGSVAVLVEGSCTRLICLICPRDRFVVVQGVVFEADMDSVRFENRAFGLAACLADYCRIAVMHPELGVVDSPRNSVADEIGFDWKKTRLCSVFGIDLAMRLVVIDTDLKVHLSDVEMDLKK